MYGHAYTISGVVSIIGRLYVHCLITHKANRNRDTVEFSQGLVKELRDHLRDVLDLAHIHFKEKDHDGSANLRSNAIVTMISLLEIYRTLAVCETVSAATRQHSRSECGGLLSNIALTAQKVVVMDGKYLSNFIVVCINVGSYRVVSCSCNCSMTQVKIRTLQILQMSFHL